MVSHVTPRQPASEAPYEDEAVFDGGDKSRFDPGKACGYDPDVPTVDVAT
jgi:hypothetical protein